MRTTGLLLASLAVLGVSSAERLVADNIFTSTLGRSVFEFDHFRPDFGELTRHPYMRSYCNDNGQDSVEQMLSKSFSKSRFRRSMENNATDVDKTLNLIGTGMPNLDLEVKFKVPMLNIYESTFLNFNIPINFNIPLYTVTYLAARDWEDKILPALDDLEGIVSILGLDGRSCVLRAVCEIAESPVIRPEGLVGEMLEIFINYLTMETPESNEIDGVEILSRRRREYSEASLKGRAIGGCADHYPTCPISLFNIRTSAQL